MIFTITIFFALPLVALILGALFERDHRARVVQRAKKTNKPAVKLKTPQEEDAVKEILVDVKVVANEAGDVVLSIGKLHCHMVAKAARETAEKLLTAAMAAEVFKPQPTTNPFAPAVPAPPKPEPASSKEGSQP